MQSQVVSGVPPSSLFLLSLQQKDYPPSFHLSLLLFFLLPCLSVSLSLSLLCPFISLHPSPLSWYFSLLLREGFLVKASSSWQWGGRCTVCCCRSHRHWVLSCGTVAYWTVAWSVLIYLPYTHFTSGGVCAFKSISVVYIVKCLNNIQLYRRICRYILATISFLQICFNWCHNLWVKKEMF